MSYLPESDSEDELPSGWMEQVKDGGSVCFINVQSKAVQWTHPRTGRLKYVVEELPIGWQQSFDEANQCNVFHNTITKQSTFVDPRLAFTVERPPKNINQIRQRFDASSTALQVLHGKDLQGRLAIITGANSGIGYETARSLALHDCEVIFACRNQYAAEEAIKHIVRERPTAGGRLRYIELNLASFYSVKCFTEQIRSTVKHIDYLILNAGVFALPYTQTEDGIETTFQVSHLSHFYLTLQLEKLFNHTTRIIVVSSESHRFANLPIDKLTDQHLSPQSAKQYWSMMAYNNSKLCNILFAQELAKRWQQRQIAVFSLHPGNMVSTRLQRNWWFYRLLFALVRPFTKSLQQAAATSIYCATANELNGFTGLYFNNCYICEPSELAKNEQLRQQLWQLSIEILQTLEERYRKQEIPYS